LEIQFSKDSCFIPSFFTDNNKDKQEIAVLGNACPQLKIILSPKELIFY